MHFTLAQFFDQSKIIKKRLVINEAFLTVGILNFILFCNYNIYIQHKGRSLICTKGHLCTMGHFYIKEHFCTKTFLHGVNFARRVTGKLCTGKKMLIYLIDLIFCNFFYFNFKIFFFFF